MASWAHPELGTFASEAWGGWTRRSTHPAFTKFKGGGDAFHLTLDTDEPEEEPSADVVAMALSTLANCERLIESGLQALCDDFHGRGRDGGMWWRDGVDQILEILEKKDSPEILDGPEKLYDWMSVPSILAQARGMGYPHPCSIISFQSPIDEEHGIGILTDGQDVIGIGYQTDTCPFEG